MANGFLHEHWALVGAAALLAIVVTAVIRQWHLRTAGGQLREVLKAHRKVRAEYRRAARNATRAQKQVEKLEKRAEHVKPRRLEESRQALADAEALTKILEDKLQVTANHVRRVIHEEFPPRRQPALRARFLPEDGPDGRPFSFGR